MRLIRNKQSGFTLIELVMVILIIGIVSVVVGKILFQSHIMFLTAESTTSVEWQGLLVLERINEDIHSIRSSGDISTAQASQLIFTDVSGNSVQYQASGSSLLRSSQAIASGVQSFSLAYYDKNGAVTATPSAIRYIGVNLTLSQSGVSVPFSTFVGTRGME